MSEVKMWKEEVIIPTYEIGAADKNPMFLEKRVYQGSSGKVYPYPTIEKISDEKKEKAYQAVFLENQYLKIMILPELGGRIQRAYDKTNNYDFVYYNHVIKPALVGLTGPWISGGIEFNWPQHHRPTTFLPVDFLMVDGENGGKTVLINDVDQMYGTKGIAGITLYPDKAYIEIKGQLYNRTAIPQTFLWWANPAVAVNDHTQSIFPPDVHAVMDHGKRDVSRFPIATGIYYKHDYSEGVDISRYKNIPVPTSYMAEKSDYDFVGGYDYGKKAGILHVADHHISPGKKQWTWGCGDFGKAWDRNLTDEDGPYIELMTGVYTDNQPDFTWLKPFEEKTFTQYFMPYKAVGQVKNATIHAAVNLIVKDKQVYICAYGTEKYENAKVCLTYNGIPVFEEDILLSPTDIFERTIDIVVEEETKLNLTIMHNEKILVSYQPKKKAEVEELPQPAQAAKDPQEIRTNEELYLTGLHIEQYRHATYLPDPYYLEGLKRDEGDIRINNAYGLLLLKRGCFKKSETHFRTALKRLTWKNPNPYDSEAYYNLGLTLFFQDRLDEAYDAFYKATWSNEQQEMSFYYLAVIDARRKNYISALEMIEKGLLKNAHNSKACALKAHLYRKLNRIEDTKKQINQNLTVDKFDYISRYEAYLVEDNTNCLKDLLTIMRDFPDNFLQAGRDYAEYGAYEEAIEMLLLCSKKTPLLYYYQAYYQAKLGEENQDTIADAENCSSDYCFPNKLEDIAVLEYAITHNDKAAKANYYLGNLYYDKLQFDVATKLWEDSLKIDDSFPTVIRNLALSYYNKFGNKEAARNLLEKAYQLNKMDSRIFLELDQLYKKLAVPFQERLNRYEENKEVFQDRDDLYIEYVTLYNMLGRYEEAHNLIMGRTFHPWEGGEGKITTQYTLCLVEMAKEKIKNKEFEEAKELLEKALNYPENLGEGRLEGTKNNHVYYYMGLAYEGLNQIEKARQFYEIAGQGTDEPAGMMYYNDQPADMILYQGLSKAKLGKQAEANARFYKLIDYGERHMFDTMRIEYFAVSLPDFLIFDEDLNIKNRAHCQYLIGLGRLGMGEMEKAENAFGETLSLDYNHMLCRIYQKMI